MLIVNRLKTADKFLWLPVTGFLYFIIFFNGFFKNKYLLIIINYYIRIGFKVRRQMLIALLQQSVCQRKLTQVFGNLLRTLWEAKTIIQFMFRAPDRCTEWTGPHGMVDTRPPRSSSEWFSIKVSAQNICPINK